VTFDISNYILTWLRGFQDKLLYLVLFSLFPSLFWELRDKRNFKNLQFWPQSLGAMLEYWYIKCGLLQVDGLLTKCEVKMAGYWPSSFFACLWSETELRSINSQKKEQGQYPAILTEQVWSIKDLLHGFRGNFVLWDTVGSPEQAS